MNIFYAPPSQINNGFIELLDQEAAHASKVLRASEGDKLQIVDGKGGRYEGLIRRITKKSIQVEIKDHQRVPTSKPELILGMGIIKKRDRLEFAVEKAVELGVSKILLFRSDHSIKENVRMDRLESIAVSAMKQSLRAWLPEISLYTSLNKLVDEMHDAEILAAHEKVDAAGESFQKKESDKKLLLVGPEGGFSDDEVNMFRDHGARLVSLGEKRLRTETAVIALLSQFL
mgnify:CR=1 FL=1